MRGDQLRTPEQRLVQAARDILAGRGVELSDESCAFLTIPVKGGDDLRVPVIFGIFGE